MKQKGCVTSLQTNIVPVLLLFKGASDKCPLANVSGKFCTTVLTGGAIRSISNGKPGEL